MSNAFLCPSCSSQLTFSGDLNGIRARCSRCGTVAASQTFWDFGDESDRVGRETGTVAAKVLSPPRRAPRTHVRSGSRGPIPTMIMPVISEFDPPIEPIPAAPEGWDEESDLC